MDSQKNAHPAAKCEPNPRAGFQLNNERSVAVALDYYWMPVGPDTPRGVKLQLLGRGGVATHGLWDGRSTFWTHWTPLPRMPKNEVP